MLREKRGKAIKTGYLVVFIIILLFIMGYLLSPRERIDQDQFNIYSSKLPKSFDGFRISHLSDLHNKVWKDKDKLPKLIREEKPDIIVITGDLIDSRKPDAQVAYDFIKSIKDIAPIYFVTGNHESALDYNSISSELESLGVVLMDGQSIDLKKGEGSIKLMGLPDPKFIDDYSDELTDGILSSLLQDDKYQSQSYRVLLSHRPEAFDAYVRNHVDLVLSGHAHGGQFRLPFIGGLIAPGQGILPKYTNGVYVDNKTAMIVSRGLGDSILPIRMNNNYHLITIVLKKN